MSVIYYRLRAPVDYVGGSCWGNGNEGPPCLKSRCSCELFSPLIRSLSYEMEEGLESPCVYMQVCVRGVRGGRLRRGSETMGASRPSQKPASLATATPAGMHQREREKSHSGFKSYFTSFLLFFLLLLLSSSPRRPFASPLTSSSPTFPPNHGV